jgi:hypothetical protein
MITLRRSRRCSGHDRDQRTKIRRQRTEIRRQRTEDRGQKIKDRGKRAEDRRQRFSNLEFGMWNFKPKMIGAT